MATSFCRHKDATQSDLVDVSTGTEVRLSIFDYILKGSDAGPQGFLVRMFGPSVGPAHFHPVDQFQLFFPGEDSTYLRSKIVAPVVHYTDAYSTYGPFGSSGAPIEFFTLRAQQTREIGYMPQDRDRLLKRGKRNLQRELSDALLASTQQGGKVFKETLFGSVADQMSAVYVSAGAEADVPVASAADTNGRYYCVLEGDLIFEGGTYGPRSLGWTTPGSAGPNIRAGGAGLKLVMMTFPSPSTEMLDLV